MSNKNNLAQTDIFSTFGIFDEYAEKKKREEEERKRKAEELQKQIAKQQTPAKSQSQGKEKTKDVFKVNEDTVIRYFGESIDIHTYFTSEEIAEGLLVKKKGSEAERKPLDGELLRKRMEKDYPELVKDMTEMVYLKKKNIIVPIMKAKKKGNVIETSSAEDVSLSKQIPFRILRDFIALARFYAEYSLEVHADIYMDSNEIFILDIPKQRVNRLWCEVVESPTEIANRVEDAIKVMEIHSHHSMKPKPSRQDNESERLPGMLYAIVGCLHKDFPDITIRKFISESEGHIAIPYSKAFENPFYSLPEWDMNNVEVIL